MRKVFFAISITCLTVFNLNAQKSSQETKGDYQFSIYNFEEAIVNYTKSKNLTTEGQRRLAESYRNTGNTIKAEETYAEVVKQNDVIAEDYFNYASALNSNGKYELFKSWMEKFKNAKPNDLRAKNYAADVSQLNNLLKDHGKYKIEHLAVNTAAQDFGPSYFYNDMIVFASTRGGSPSIKKNYNWNQKPFLDLYVSVVQNGQFGTPVVLNKKLNKSRHEGPATFYNDGNNMAFTRNSYSGKGKDGVIRFQIFFTTKQNGKWVNEEAFTYNSEEYSTGHPCYNSDGSIMYFASDMPGGFGGSDIYRVQKDANGKWGKPENMGDNVNTEGNEMFPFFEENTGFLFFASNGHLGLGGLDIFLAPTLDEGTGKALNLGTPMNSAADDFGLIVDSKMKKGYFCSNKSGGSGDDDIYSFEFLSPISVNKIINGIVKDKSGNSMADAEVILLDEKNNIVKKIKTKSDGSYEFEIEDGGFFLIKASKESYLPASAPANTTNSYNLRVSDLVLDKDPGSTLHLVITDKGTKNPLEGVKVKLTNNLSGKSEDLTENTNGDYSKILSEIKVNDRISYNIALEKPGYVSKTVTFNKLIEKNGKIAVHQEIDLSLDKIAVGLDLAKAINIAPIYFDLGKSTIRKDAANELDKIVKVMNENPNMVVELGSHTDCRGSAASNQALSTSRAKASAEYIKSKISTPSRISGKGYGESKLQNNCACEGNKKSTCSEEEHQQNRRTEFIIVSVQ